MKIYTITCNISVMNFKCNSTAAHTHKHKPTIPTSLKFVSEPYPTLASLSEPYVHPIQTAPSPRSPRTTPLLSKWSKKNQPPSGRSRSQWRSSARPMIPHLKNPHPSITYIHSRSRLPPLSLIPDSHSGTTKNNATSKTETPWVKPSKPDRLLQVKLHSSNGVRT